MFFKFCLRNFVQHVLWKYTLGKNVKCYFSRINVTYEHWFASMSNLKKFAYGRKKIGFGKIRIIRKEPSFVLINKLGKETNRNKTKRTKRCWKEYINENLPAEQVTFLIRNKHKKNSRWNWVERMKKEYMLAKDKTRHKVWEGVEYTRHSLKSLVKHFPLFQASTDILFFFFVLFTNFTNERCFRPFNRRRDSCLFIYLFIYFFLQIFKVLT